MPSNLDTIRALAAALEAILYPDLGPSESLSTTTGGPDETGKCHPFVELCIPVDEFREYRVALSQARPQLALLVKLVDAVKRLRDYIVAADRAEDFPDANRRWQRAQDDLASARRQVDTILAELETQ